MMKKQEKKNLPADYIPSAAEADWFINYWNGLPSYSNQERALDKLFKELCKTNNCIEDVLIKCSALNDFYSTNIFDIHTVAQHILKLHIDERLNDGDPSLVEDIAKVEVNGKRHNFYSFATKYCSHHQPEHFAIFDSYVEKVLISLNNKYHFANFTKEGLKDYKTFMEVIDSFQKEFNLSKYPIKLIDQYLWQLGKWYFNNYGIAYKYYNREAESPYDGNSIEDKFWYGEKNFVDSYQSVGYWKNEGKEWLKEANKDIIELANRLTPEQFGVITYIYFHTPTDDRFWVPKY